MAGKITDLTALTGAGAATTDLIEALDVSDTTMAGTGTNKKMTLAELVIFLNANGITLAAASETVSGRVELADAAETLAGTDNTRAVHPAGLAPLVGGDGPLFAFLFNTTTSAGTGTNQLRLNNATPASATALYVNYSSRVGIDLKIRLLAGTAGDRIFIQDRASSANYRIYELTGTPTDNSTYATCNVVHRGGAGSLWANGAAIIAGFTTPPITIGTSAPASPLTNDLWIDTT